MNGGEEKCILDIGGKARRKETTTRWVNKIKLDLRDKGWDCMNWIDVAQDRDQWRALVNMEIKLQVP
jgi:hypothetical protein